MCTIPTTDFTEKMRNRNRDKCDHTFTTVFRNQRFKVLVLTIRNAHESHPKCFFYTAYLTEASFFFNQLAD